MNILGFIERKRFTDKDTGKRHTQPSREEALISRVVIERCLDTNLYVGYVPDFPGAHSQGKTKSELKANLQEVITMLLKDEKPI